MKPFLLLGTRPEDAAADGELEAVARFGGLRPDELVRVRLEAAPMPALALDDFSGVIVGGSPFNASDPPADKSATQLRVEAELAALLDEVVARDFPFLGACYGVGTLGVHQGGVVDRTYGEAVGAVPVTLTADGRRDPVFEGLPDTFDAFVGHKEAIHTPPPHAVVLATSPGCPVQAFRVKTNLYATQFHPELDVPGIVTRIEVYRHAGYFPADTTEELIVEVSEQVVDHPPRVLANFVRRYARD
ncbi:glutamine amidotransferase [Isoptericola sp. b441]|uniref:Glutamine amidotransferase n=1 Tax=Actinotalea lenta TaxID=3064654 RepID=A0ABT9D6U2_9CELL|nr:glutamine amidotransferase [Isoptericola sp. b441]MDO8106563.1 glutamine amidotransferase [Isoptericola sp. b441]